MIVFDAVIVLLVLLAPLIALTEHEAMKREVRDALEELDREATQ